MEFLLENRFRTVYVSESGIVYFTEKKDPSKTLKEAVLFNNNKGYVMCSYGLVHRLVATLYIDNPYNLPEVNHLDGDKLNNHKSNLEWSSGEGNIEHSFERKLSSGKYLSDDSVRELVNKYNKGKVSMQELATEYGICRLSVMKYVSGRVRKELGIVDQGYRKRGGRPPER